MVMHGYWVIVAEQMDASLEMTLPFYSFARFQFFNCSLVCHGDLQQSSVMLIRGFQNTFIVVV